MKHLLLILLTSLSWNIIAQNDFQYIYSNQHRVETGSILELSNNNYILFGNIYDSIDLKSDWLVMELQNDGTIAWQKQYGRSDNEYARAIIHTSTNHLLLLGETFENGHRDILIAKIMMNGDTVWTKIISGNIGDGSSKIIEDANGDFYIIGTSDSYGQGGTDILLLKIDANGNVLWSKTYGGTQDDNGFGITKHGNGYLITGNTKSTNNSSQYGVLISIDVSGNIQWQKAIGGVQDDYLYWSETRIDSSIYVGGYTSSFGFGALDAFLLKLDFTGNIQWAKVYGTSHIDFATTYASTPSGSLIFAGGEDFFTFKTDNSGDLKWGIQYKIRANNNPNRDLPQEIISTVDNHYLIAGKTSDFQNSNVNIYIAKVDTTGAIPCKGLDGRSNQMIVQPATPTVSLTVGSPMISSVLFGLSMPIPNVVATDVCATSNITTPSIQTFQISPNPVVDIINIEIEDETLFDYKIYTANGQLAKAGKWQKGQLMSCAELQNGWYIIQLANGQNIWQSRFVISD